MKRRNWNIKHTTSKPTLLIIPHVTVLLGKESDDTILRCGHVLLIVPMKTRQYVLPTQLTALSLYVAG